MCQFMAHCIFFTTFHQSYGYEEFIQGLRPDTTSDKLSFKTVDGVFKKIADKAMDKLKEENKQIVLDEIKRKDGEFYDKWCNNED